MSGRRAPDLGLPGNRGPNDAITDVAGVRVGHRTLVSGEAVRTGVTVILPHEGEIWREPLFAGCHRLNGNGEVTGLEWIRESGLLTSPVALTNTHSVGVVRDALVAWEVAARPADEVYWALPVVGETWDGVLNDIGGQHVRAEHALEAIEAASDGAVVEGNVGGGTGMVCHGFKGGIGTASRVVSERAGHFTVGALVQANHGRRHLLRVDGAPVGGFVPSEQVPLPGPASGVGAGSIIVVLATDAPLLPHQLDRLAQRAGLGVARCGGIGEHTSGDIFLAFSTANRGMPAADAGVTPPVVHPVSMLADVYITELFGAAVEATEEAIVNALLAAETMSGRGGNTAYALGADRLAAILERYRR